MNGATSFSGPDGEVPVELLNQTEAYMGTATDVSQYILNPLALPKRKNLVSRSKTKGSKKKRGEQDMFLLNVQMKMQSGPIPHGGYASNDSKSESRTVSKKRNDISPYDNETAGLNMPLGR